MSFGLRGGNFGGTSLNPFGSNAGGLGQYNIGSAANEEAALDKYEAQVAWNQGRITDGAYISALEKFLGTTEKGSRERIAAQDDLQDARYTVGRNEIVSSLNGATSTVRRISLWRDLIAHDRKHLSTMTAGDNEQRRELESRIDEEEGSIRKESWSEMVRRYNSRKGLPIEVMLRAARRLARASVGSRDHQDWLGEIDKWTETQDNETLQGLQQEWQKHPDTGGSAVLRFLDTIIAKTGEGTPRRNQLQATRDDTARTIATNKRTRADGDMEDGHKDGSISDEAYLQYWARRLKDSPKGSNEQRGLKQKVYDITLDLSIKDGHRSWVDTGSPARLLGAYNAALAGMVFGSQAYRETQQTILGIQQDAWKAFDLMRGDPSKGGGTIYTSGNYGSPPNTPGTGADGFASQYDGSEFASQNCGYTAAAMLAWAAGKRGLSGGDMRWYAGDPSGASMLSGMATAMEHVGLALETNFGYGLGSFRRRVANGEAAIVNGLYGNLSGQFRLSSFAGAHSVTVTNAKKSGGTWWYYVMDPIGRGAGQGAQWWPEQVMQRFAWSGATNPISGNELTGVVAFARKGGRSVKRGIANRNNVPPQYFDTDANGKSTIGKGGGTSRAEAGYMPPDFAKRARGGKAGTSTDEIAVWSFLGAVSKVARPEEMPRSDVEEKQWIKRATKLLDKYDGDIQRAGAEWFTRAPATADKADFSKDQLYYANAIGGQYKLPDIGPTPPAVVGPGTAGTEAPADVVARMTPQGTPPPNPDEEAGPDTAEPVAGPTLAAYSTGAVDIAQRALKAAGIDVTDQNTRAIIATLEALNGGTENIDPLNPFRLSTEDEDQFHGQTGIGEGGTPLFLGSTDPTQSAIEAWASIVPDEVVAAGRSRDPRIFLDALGNSGMSEALANGNLIRTWNANPGNDNVYGRGPADVPSSIAGLVSQEPGLEAMYSIDPLDPRQLDWYKRNVAAQLDAASNDRAKWTFERPDGSTVQLDYFPYLVVETSENTYNLQRQIRDYHVAAGDDDKAAKAMAEGIATLDPGQLTIEGLRDVTRDMTAMRDAALLTEGGVGKARDIMLELHRIYAETMQSSEDVSVPVVAAGGGTVQTTERRWVADVGAAQDPRFINDPELLHDMEGLIEGTNADPILDLLMPGTDADGKPVPGIDVDGNANPSRGFVTVSPGKDGKPYVVEVHTDRKNKEEFVLYDKVAADGSTEKVPVWTRDRIPVTMPGGVTIWQQPQAQDAPVMIYTNDATSVNRAVTQDTTNLGPEEQVFRGQQALGMFVLVPDTTDPDGDRFVRYWTLGADVDGTTTWLAMPENVTPSVVYTGEGRLTQDPANPGQLLANGKTVTPDQLAGMVSIYGIDETTRVKGVEGTGGPHMNLVVKVTKTGEHLDGTLGAGDRFKFGGAYWPRDWAPPISDIEVAVGSVRATDVGPRPAPDLTKAPFAYEGNPPGDYISAMPGTAPATPAPDTREVYGPPAPTSTLPHGSPRLSDLTAWLRNAARPVTTAIAREAERTRALQSAATARAADLHRQEVARAAQAREAQRIRSNLAQVRSTPTFTPPLVTPREATPRQSAYVDRNKYAKPISKPPVRQMPSRAGSGVGSRAE